MFSFTVNLNNSGGGGAVIPPNPSPFGEYTLPFAANTSAGVYWLDTSTTPNREILVRTLWVNQDQAIGLHTMYWDGEDDLGVDIMGDHPYYGKVQYSNVIPTWEGGFIGNTSDDIDGIGKWVRNKQVICMCIAGTTGYTGSGYGEAKTALRKFTLGDAQSSTPLFETFQTNFDMDYMCTNGTYVFVAGPNPNNASQSMVWAFKTSDDSEVVFANGTPLTGAVTGGTRNYASVIAYVSNSSANQITGICCNDNFLWVARGSQNSIYAYDLIIDIPTGLPSGALASTTSGFVSCAEITYNTQWSTVWTFVSNFVPNGIFHCTFNATTGALAFQPLTISDFPSNKLTMAMDNVNHLLLITVGSTTQQTWAFNVAPQYPGGTKNTWKLGQLGGYATDPAVANDKFYFNDGFTQVGKTWICTQSDGSFWIGDNGNERFLHFNSSRAWIETVGTLPLFYSSYTDRNDPTRQFAVWLQFEIDYSLPLAGTNGSWALVKNWRYGVILRNAIINPSTGVGEVWNHADNEVAIMDQVLTFSGNSTPALNNGRTYAWINNYLFATSNTAGSFVPSPTLCELPSSGYWTPSPITAGTFGQWHISQEGNIYYLSGANNVGDTPTMKERLLTGYDGSNFPTYAAATTIVTYPTIVDTDAVFNPKGIPVYTASGDAIIFNGQVRDETSAYHTGFALSSIHRGGDKYLYQTAMRTYQEYRGPFPLDGSFDIGNNTNNAGGIVTTTDDYVLINHHGEFWKQSQTNYFFLYSKIGLPIAIFGITIPIAIALYGRYAPQEAAGNTFAGNLVMYSGNLYAYYNDESVHSAVHRWKITALDTIATLDVVLSPPTSFPIPGRNLLANLPFKDFSYTGDADIVFSTAPYYVDGGNYFTGATSIQSSSSQFISLDTTFNGRTIDRTVNIALDPTGMTTSMAIVGNINFAGNTAREFYSPTAGGTYFRILDATGKMLVNIFTEYVSGPSNPTTLWCNKATNAVDGAIYTANDNVFVIQSSKPNPITITITSAGVVFSWGVYTSNLLAFEDPTANYLTPTTMQIFYDAGPATIDRALSIQQNFYRTII